MGLPSLTFNQPLAWIKTVPVYLLPETVGCQGAWEIGAFPAFLSHAWTDSLIRILILNLPENRKILCTQSLLKTRPGFSPPHTFRFFLAPYIHSRATPFPCLAFPTYSVVPPRMTPHTHQSGWTRCPRIFVARSLLDTQGWSFRRGTSLSDCSESNQGGRPGVLREYKGVGNTWYCSPISRDKKSRHFIWPYVKIWGIHHLHWVPKVCLPMTIKHGYFYADNSKISE